MESQGLPYLKGLSRHGATFFLLTFEKIKDRKRIAELRNDLEKYNIEWLPLRYHKRPSVPATLFDIFTGIISGIYLVFSKNIDIIHARATVPAAMAYVIAKITRRRFIFDVRGLMAEEYADGGMWKKDGICYRSTLYLQKMFLKDANELIVITGNIRTFFMESGYLNKKTKNISVIPCCVDTNRFNRDAFSREKLRNKHNLSGRFIFLYAGSLGTWYLLEEMLDFFIAAKSVIPNAHFLILTHTGKDMAVRASREKGLFSKDITVSEARFEDMPGYINMADAGVFFIKPVFSKRSSCPTKFAEYLACGLPVVINSGIGDTDVMVKERSLGVVIDGFDRDSYLRGARGITELIKEKELLSDRCRRAAEEEFSLDMGVSRYFDIYRRAGCG